jgi:dTDP-4-amino-4,6-dideoxygalactose transaminase
MSAADTLPALLGGPLVRPQGPPDWPLPDDDVRQALLAAYADGSWGKYFGPHVEKLTARLAEFHQVEFALTCGSGTFAVELALRALKLDRGAEVHMAAYDYGGNFLSIHAVGAQPVLLDVHSDNWNIDVGRVENAIGPATRAIIVSHLHGGMAPMSKVMAMAQARGLAVIEDAAQMPGAWIEGRKAGTWGDVGVLSFGGSKLLSAGRGGAILTRRADIHQRAKTLQQRGNIVNPLSELQAAVLLPQLAKLDAHNARRREAVAHLTEKLQEFSGIRPFVNRLTNSEPGYYKFGWQYDETKFGLPRERLLAAMRAEGIALDDGFRALHVGRSPARFRQAGDLVEAEKAHRGCVVLHHPVLLGTQADWDEVVLALRKVQAHAKVLV